MDRDRLQALLDSSMDGFLLVDDQLRIKEVNGVYLGMSGYSRDELLALGVPDLEALESPEEIGRRARLIRETGGARFETRHRRKDGTQFDVENSVRPVPSADGGYFVFLRDITDRKRAEHRFKDMVWDMEVGVLVQGPGAEIRLANPKALELLGLSEDQLLGKTSFDPDWTVVHEDGAPFPGDQHPVPQAIAGRKPVRDVTMGVFRPRNGTTSWIRVDAEPRLDVQGNVQEVICTFVDVSARHHYESTMKRYQERLEMAMGAADIAWWEMDVGSGEVIFDHRKADLLGYPADRFHHYRDFLALVHPDDADRALETMMNHLSGTLERYDLEYRILAHDGSYRWFADTGVVRERDPRGIPLKVTGITMDVTRSKKNIEDLRRVESSFQLFADNVSDMLTFHAPDGTYTYLSPSCRVLLGYEPQELVGINPYTLFHPDDVPAIQDTHSTVVRGLPVNLIQYRIKRKDGRYAWLETNNKFVTGPQDGQVTSIICISRDISDRKRMEEEIQKIQRLESLGTLAGGIAHDFNNLMAGLVGNLDLVRMALQGHDQAQALVRLEKTRAIFDHGKALTRRLLTFSKGGTPVRAPVDLGPLVAEWTELVLVGSEVRVDLETAPDLPACDCDVNQIVQVFNNLLINARQASPPGKPVRVRVYTSLIEGTSFLTIEIADQGPGIPPEIQPKIFDPFFTTKPTGSGLGLSVAYSIIKNHGGWIDVDTAVGAGSRFTVYLPTASEQVHRSREPAATRFTGSGTALVMDDEPAVLESTGAMLESFGYHVLRTSDGREVLEAYDQSVAVGPEIGVFLLDNFIVGGMGGLETAKQLRDRGCRARIILMSGYFSAGDTDGTPDPDRLPKPFTSADLGQVLKKGPAGPQPPVSGSE